MNIFTKRTRRGGLLVLVAAFAATISTNYLSVFATPPPQTYDPTQSCGSLQSTHIADVSDNVAFTVQSAISDPGNASQPASCQVTVTATHPPAGDTENIWIWLPAAGWNGRFEGTGGGGFSGGSISSLAAPLSQGYIAGATDTGHPGSSGSYVLNPDNSLNWQLVDDDHLAVHEMTVAGKALADSFYGQQVHYAYFNGCSTGGRQGINEARQYPADYDGILAGSPAINITKQRIVGLWGQLLMKQSNDFIPQCKFNAANTAAVQACDKLDGVQDGVITDPRDCTFDPHTLVGTSTPCGTITQTDADIIAKIWQGARDTQGNFMWYGPEPGASFAGLNNTTVVNGQLDGAPASFMLDWVRYFLLQNPNWDWHTLSYQQFEQLFTQSTEEFGTVLSDSPDLTAFQHDGGKLLMWHGWNDQLVAPQGSTSFYEKVASLSGGLHQTQDFARLFMAPGVAHCGGGNGPQPADPMSALVDWVEHHHAPDTLLAEKRDTGGNVTETRPLCPYPATAAYKGHGDTNDAANFQCQVTDHGHDGGGHGH